MKLVNGIERDNGSWFVNSWKSGFFNDTDEPTEHKDASHIKDESTWYSILEDGSNRIVNVFRRNLERTYSILIHRIIFTQYIPKQYLEVLLHNNGHLTCECGCSCFRERPKIKPIIAEFECLNCGKIVETTTVVFHTATDLMAVLSNEHEPSRYFTKSVTDYAVVYGNVVPGETPTKFFTRRGGC